MIPQKRVRLAKWFYRRIKSVRKRELVRWYTNPDITRRRTQKAIDFYDKRGKGCLEYRAVRPVHIHNGRKPR